MEILNEAIKINSENMEKSLFKETIGFNYNLGANTKTQPNTCTRSYNAYTQWYTLQPTRV